MNNKHFIYLQLFTISLFVITLFLFRLAFIEDYTLKSLRLKPEKWNKLVISDDQRGFLHSFVDQGMNSMIVLI